MNQVIKFALPVMTVVVGIWVAQMIPNPLSMLMAKK